MGMPRKLHYMSKNFHPSCMQPFVTATGQVEFSCPTGCSKWDIKSTVMYERRD